MNYQILVANSWGASGSEECRIISNDLNLREVPLLIFSQEAAGLKFPVFLRSVFCPRLWSFCVGLVCEVR